MVRSSCGMLRNVDVIRIAAAATADPRTVKRFLRGSPVRSMCEHRIAAAVASLNLGHLVTAAPVSPAAVHP